MSSKPCLQTQAGETGTELSTVLSKLNPEKIIVRPGIEITFADHLVQKWTRIAWRTSDEVCDFLFFLYGKVGSDLKGVRSTPELIKQSVSIWLTPQLETVSEFFPGDPIRFLSIRILRPVLYDMIGSNLRGAGKAFLKALADSDRVFFRNTAMTIPMQAVLCQILQCPYHGNIKNLFLEGKVLELIAHLMSNLFCLGPEDPPPFRNTTARR